MWKRRISILVISIVAISLISGWIAAAAQKNDFFSAALTSFITIIKIFLILTIAYVPLIILIRKWWKKRLTAIDFKNSQKAKAWNKFLRNNNAMAGVITLFYALLLFIFGHLIAPDKTPNANDQINELSFKPPGFQIKVIDVPLPMQVQDRNFFSWMIHGKPNHYQEMPLNTFWFRNDSVYAERYFGEGIKGQVIGFTLSEITKKDLNIAENRKLIENSFIHDRRFFFGTDDLGRDYMSRIILGVRVSLLVGFVAVLIALFIGIPLGAFAGFYKSQPPRIHVRGKRYLKFPLDGLIMWFINVIWAIPTLLLVFPIVFAFGQNYYTIFIAVGLTMWVDIARIVRGQVMQVRQLEYIQAAKSFGYSDMRTIFIHILPNITGPIIVITAANFAYAILTEAGLSFLGIGVQPPAPSWGLMISKYKDNLITEPYLTLIPGIAITILVLAFFMIGNGVRDALDVKAKVEH